MRNAVNPLRGPTIPLKLLMPLGGKAQIDSVAAHQNIPGKQIHLPRRLMHRNRRHRRAFIHLRLRATPQQRHHHHNRPNSREPSASHLCPIVKTIVPTLQIEYQYPLAPTRTYTSFVFKYPRGPGGRQPPA